MAPALTEPISPTEKLSSTPATTSASPATRSSSRKLEALKNNKSSANSGREKRNCNGNILKNQTPTPPPHTSLRSSRSKETQKRELPISLQSSSTLLPTKNSQQHTEIAGVPETGTTPDIFGETDIVTNEQMGLSTAPADKKNIKNFEKTSKVEPAKDQDTSTAQLLADLTNEALTAEICLRNQLKDIDLAKVGEGNSSPVQRSNDIVLKTVATAVLPTTDVETTKKDTAHMEALCLELKTKSSAIQKKLNEVETLSSDKIASCSLEKHLQNEQVDNKNEDKAKSSSVAHATFEKHCSQEEPPILSPVHQDSDESSKAIHCGSGADNDMETMSAQESPIGSPDFSDSDATKKNTKPRILEVQELPPVSTDSTMTASEVEDNLEERLSQLDGTAIDSPPPNQDIDKDVTLKGTDHIDQSTTTPPRTPTHQQQQQQTLSQDLQQIQQQLQNTPPTPIAQQVQGHHLQQHQAQNSFTPQSTTSVSSLGSGNIPQSFIKENDGGTELEDQDIEEVFKVLKGFEGGTTSDLNVCDLNVLFNEVYMKMNESEIGTNTSNVTVGGGIVQNNPTNAVNPSIQPVKPTELEEGQLDIEKRQQQMQRKVDFLMRRLRKQQSRHMCKHTSEEIGGLFEWSSRQSAKGVQHIMNSSSSELGGGSSQDPSKYFLKVIAARPPATDWKNIQEATVPATQLSAFLRKIESVANAQQLRVTSTPIFSNLTTSRRSKKVLSETTTGTLAKKSKTPLTETGRAEEVIVSPFDENVTDELTQVAGLLQSEMCEVQRAIDSDATESSSGGESADEMVSYNNQQQQTLPITKRAAWRYSRDRAAIASRWSWLLSQISDLEIKIRQHSELHQEILLSKGPVICPSENGLKIEATKQNGSDKEDVGGSCRTRGFLTTQFRKRKLIQTTNIHTISKKAARPSSIKCGCQWPLHPCALCTGRSDPTAPRDLPDTMMMSDRIALLDSGYHPVLSFKDNVNNALHFEAIAKQSEWQQKVMRCQAKSIAKSVWKAERDALSSGGLHTSSSKKNIDTTLTSKRRYVKKKDRIANEEKSLTSTTACSATKTDAAAAATNTKGPALSDIDAGNGTANTLTSTTSTTPLVANKETGKSVKHQLYSLGDKSYSKDPPTPRIPNTYSNSMTSMSTTTPMSDCLPTNSDQYNPNQIPSSLISNNNNNISKSNKNRKNSSASVAAGNSHSYNHYHHHHNNNNTNIFYNGDSNYYSLGNDWAAAGGLIDGHVTVVRSRTSSPTHGNYHKYERSVDRKNRISYDIDNIVIPYSVAAATRVEILPYKEIPTPKWRLVESEIEEKNQLFEDDVDSQTKIQSSITNGFVSDKEQIEDLTKPTLNTEKTEEESESKNVGGLRAESDIKTPNILSDKNDISDINDVISKPTSERNDCGERDINEPVFKKMKTESPIVIEKSLNDNLDEDISNDAMIMRHERALAEERRKFQTYLKFPWSTRSRANRRIDSRAESSGANTPDPSSPASHTQCVGIGDQESIPSPSNPSTPLTPFDTISEAGDFSSSFLGVGLSCLSSKQRQERRRTTSTKRDREIERRDSTPDSKEIIPPYEPMQFPLSDEQFEELMRDMPLEHGVESKRFDECFLPGGSASATTTKLTRGIGVSGYTSKRSSRSSTLCGSDRRSKVSSKGDIQENGSDFLYDEDYDDYPKHHLAPNDDNHLTADNCINPGEINPNELEEDIYGDAPYNVFRCTRKQKSRNEDSDEDSTETDPFQDDDPNDPEWRGESEDRLRKKA